MRYKAARIRAACFGCLLPMLFLTHLFGQDFSKLPEWARPHAIAAAKEPAPPDANAWVVLDRTEFAYIGKGEIAIQHLRLIHVLNEKAMNQGSYILGGLGGKASRVKSIKGWNLRLDGELDRVNRGEATTIETGYDRATAVSLSNISRGSWVAWQSLQTLHSPMGPIGEMAPMEEHPIRRWEFELAKKEGWFTNLKQVKVQMDLRGFIPWISSLEHVPNQSVKLSNVPALPAEEGAPPHARNFLPRIVVRFLDPELTATPALDKGWDGLARWYSSRTQGSFNPLPAPPTGPPLEKLLTIRAYIREQFVYKQFYLSAERGWVPEEPVEVARKRYGDCKDLAHLFVTSARAAGFQAFPVLCRIVEGTLSEDEPISPYAFNHAIAAVKLEASLGLASEVETPGGRFLLVDLTERYLPLGQLSEAHSDQRVMICTESGPTWVKVPDKAILQPKVMIRLKGEVNILGRLSCDLTVSESGNALGLRKEFQEGGMRAIKEHLLRHLLDLSPATAMEVVGAGSPFEVSQPFEVSLHFDQPNAVPAEGGECAFPSFLFPSVPGTIQKMGRVRRFPVQAVQGILFEHEADIKSSIPLQAILPALNVDSPLRRLSWSVHIEPQDLGGSRVQWTLKSQRKAATFSLPEQEKGVQAWKQDRSTMQRLFRDGLAFKVTVVPR